MLNAVPHSKKVHNFIELSPSNVKILCYKLWQMLFNGYYYYYYLFFIALGNYAYTRYEFRLVSIEYYVIYS